MQRVEISGLDRAVFELGGVLNFAEKLKINPGTVYLWKSGKIPENRMLEIERLSGIGRELLRPDLYEGFERIKNETK